MNLKDKNRVKSLKFGAIHHFLKPVFASVSKPIQSIPFIVNGSMQQKVFPCAGIHYKRI
jgi:hypothetical protein